MAAYPCGVSSCRPEGPELGRPAQPETKISVVAVVLARREGNIKREPYPRTPVRARALGLCWGKLDAGAEKQKAR